MIFRNVCRKGFAILSSTTEINQPNQIFAFEIYYSHYLLRPIFSIEFNSNTLFIYHLNTREGKHNEAFHHHHRCRHIRHII